MEIYGDAFSKSSSICFGWWIRKFIFNYALLLSRDLVSYLDRLVCVVCIQGKQVFSSFGSINNNTMKIYTLMAERSKLPKSWIMEGQILKLRLFLQNINNFKFKWWLSLDNLKIKQRSFYNLSNSELKIQVQEKSWKLSLTDILFVKYHACQPYACKICPDTQTFWM